MVVGSVATARLLHTTSLFRPALIPRCHQLVGCSPAALQRWATPSVGQVYWERWSGSALMLNLFKCTSLRCSSQRACGSAAGWCNDGSCTSQGHEDAVPLVLLAAVVGDLMYVCCSSLVPACILLGALQPCRGSRWRGLSRPATRSWLAWHCLTSAGLALAHLGWAYTSEPACNGWYAASWPTCDRRARDSSSSLSSRGSSWRRSAPSSVARRRPGRG